VEQALEGSGDGRKRIHQQVIVIEYVARLNPQPGSPHLRVPRKLDASHTRRERIDLLRNQRQLLP
jgi:hypothetical protein